MRIYYINSEYESGKHKIMKVYSEYVDRALPEDSSKTAINVPYTVIEFDERYNRLLAHLLLRNNRSNPEHPLPDRFYVNNSGQIVLNDTGEVQTVNLNPQKESYKLSDLYNLTQAQLETYIDNKFAKAVNGMTPAQIKAYIDSQMATITNIATAKTVIGALLKRLIDIDVMYAALIKKMTAIELWLLKQTRMDE